VGLRIEAGEGGGPDFGAHATVQYDGIVVVLTEGGREPAEVVGALGQHEAVPPAS
jgi:hypothetical protein